MSDAPTLTPVAATERIEAIDTLRGFALLGILVMNITGLAFPMAAYFNPTVYGGLTGLNFGAWGFAHLFFDMKMMGIFSMLFGAGLILMWQRAEAAGRPFGRVWYRRTFWLLVIGLVHSYFIWFGDILVTYALCGLVLFLFRRRKARTLIVCGILVLLFGGLLVFGGGFAQTMLRDAAQEIEAKVAAGEEMTEERQALVDAWNDMRKSSAPTPEEVEEIIATMRGAPGEVLRFNVQESIAMHTQGVPFFLIWRGLALMLIGMGLMKAGVFTAERTRAFYVKCVAVGFGLGLPAIGFGIYRRSLLDFDFIDAFMVSGQLNYFASVLVSLGYVGVVMLVCLAGTWSGLRARLAAVGRMALTNYLMQSVICVVVFHGYGLALFGKVDRFGLWAFILGIWILQLAYSPWWLKRFRFGPAEWLWRTLTYWRPQSMRVTSTTE